MTTALVWLRRDLRLADNPALHHALDRHKRVIPLFLLEKEEGWPIGAASRVWLHHSLMALDASLRQRGSRLIVRRGGAAETLPKLLADIGAETVYWNRRYEPAGIAADTRLKETLTEDGLDVLSFNASLLHEPWTVSTQKDQPYRVFTPFWKNIRQRAPGNILPEPDRLPAVSDDLDSLSVDELDLLPKISWHQGIEAAWRPGEDGAHEALDRFLNESVGEYKDGRNRPDNNDTSRLSPHLHFGEIGPRQVWHAVSERLARGGVEDGAETFLKEMGWREFALHLLFHFPETTEKPMDERFEHFPWQQDAEMLKAWQQGRTGYPIVDAGMRQLWQTGWMHNRVRMIVASFLTKNLRMHWLEGARWFWDTLVDADLASNTLGWQWTAGCGADAAPYFRIFNPVSQGERHDPQGHYVRKWVPELAQLPDDAIHAPWNCEETDSLDYPAPVVDLKETRRAALDAWESIKSR